MSGTLCPAVSPKLGRTGLCDDKALYGKPMIAYFVKSTFEPSFTNFLLEATFKTGVKNETVFPLKFDSLEWADAEAGIWTSGTGVQYVTTARKHVAIIKVNASQCLKSEIIKLKNFKGGMMIGYDQRWVRGCSVENDKVIGMRIEKVLFVGEIQQGTNADDPPMLEFRVIFSSQDDFIDYAYARKMTAWVPSDLDGIHNAVITIITPTAASIIFSVHIDCDGVYVPVEGLVLADFNTTVGDGIITTLTESATTAGNYTATPTEPDVFSTGTLDLLGTTALTYDVMALQSTGAATVTI